MSWVHLGNRGGGGGGGNDLPGPLPKRRDSLLKPARLVPGLAIEAGWD